MYRWISCLLALSMTSVAAFASESQTAELAPDSSRSEHQTANSGSMEDLIELNREVLERLLVHEDPTKLDEVALEEFLVIAPGGKVETKEEAIAGVGSLDVRSVEITDEQVLSRGETVVLIGKIDADGTMRPLGELPPIKFLTVFVRVDGEWRMLARSLTICSPIAIEHGVC